MEKSAYPILTGAEHIFLPSSSRKSGVLLLHGFTSSPFEMKELAYLLHERQFSVSIPLLAGHGTIPGIWHPPHCWIGGIPSKMPMQS